MATKSTRMTLWDFFNKMKCNQWFRKSVCETSILMFSITYFPHYFTHLLAQFHYDLTTLLDAIGNEFHHLILIGFRWCAKTTYGGKIKAVHSIVYKKSRYVIFWSFEEEASKDNLFDIARELQENELILADFGQLYFEEDEKIWKGSHSKVISKRSKKTWIGNFLTSNGVRVQATSMKKTLRGKMFAAARPDLLIFDDFENNNTKKSIAMTRRAISYFDEMLWALAPWAICVYNCNRISDNGSVAWLEDKASGNPDWQKWEQDVYSVTKEFVKQKNWTVIEEEVYDIVWKDKYVETDEEALAVNDERWEKYHDRSRFVQSLETIKRTMNKDWRKVFEQEYRNQPLVEWDRLFDSEKVDANLKRAQEIEPEIDWAWQVYKRFEIGHKYIIGVDVSEGIGLDSSTIEVLDITDSVVEQVAEFESNTTDPIMLVKEIVQASKNYNDCLATVERNSVWVSVIALMKEKDMEHLLTMHTAFDHISQQKYSKYGWQTNASSKPKMLFDFKTIFHNWEIIINSVPLLREMRGFSNLDVSHKRFDPTDELSRHFDRLMAMAIGLQGMAFEKEGDVSHHSQERKG